MKLNTLKKRQDFVDMSRLGKKIAAKAVVVESNFREENSQEYPRLGFTASKKVGNSVFRNKAKRRLKESVRLVMHQNPKLFREGYDYNFIARYTTINRDFEALVKDVKYALHNVNKDDASN